MGYSPLLARSGVGRTQAVGAELRGAKQPLPQRRLGSVTSPLRAGSPCASSSAAAGEVAFYFGTF